MIAILNADARHIPLADDLAHEAQLETREQVRLWRALSSGGVDLATAYGGEGVLWR